WGDMGGYGTVAYLLNDPGVTDEALRKQLLEGMKLEADRLVEIASKDGYQVTLLPNEYRWGSNMDVMNDAMFLLIAHRLLGHPQYERIALEQIHYLLGRNVLDMSYVSGFGDRYVMNL